MAEITSGGGSHAHDKIRRKKTSTRIDMTPMVDLAFLLLTFFMLTTQLMAHYVIKLEIPKMEATTTSQTIPASRVLTLVLGENDKIYWYQGIDQPKINLTNYSSVGVRKLLFDKMKAINNVHVLIKPSDKSRYKNLVDILDEVAITELKNYSLVKITSEDKQLIAASNL
jgi:biopolymer transport protein ExbD